MECPFIENNVNYIINHLNKTDWSRVCDRHIDQINYILTSNIHYALYIHATQKKRNKHSI